MSRTVTIPIAGMTCNHCVGTVRKALESVPGVASASVDLDHARAEVTLADGMAEESRLREAVESAGYRVPDPEPSPAPPLLVSIGPIPSPPPPGPEEWDLSIGGMHCASCVSRVESALKSVPGVSEASVNLATDTARVS